MTTRTTKRTARRKPSAEALPHPGNSIDVSRQLDAVTGAYKAGVLTEAEYEAKRAPLVNALHELAAQEDAALRANGVGPLGVTIGTSQVIAGELIETAWGNQVRSDLQALNAGKVEKDGDAMTGSLTLSGASTQIVLPNNPTATTHAARKAYVDSQDALRVAIGGDTMTGQLIVGADAVADNTGVSIRSVDGKVASTFNGTGGGGTANLRLARGGSTALNAGEPYITFVRAGIGIGSVTIASGTTVAYNTTSDPRAKARTGRADDAAEIVAELGRRVYRGRWRDAETGDPTGGEWVLLNSTDVEEFAPFAVSGVADAVDGDGKPDYQMVGWSSLIPMLFAAISQQADRIAALEARLA